MSDNYDFKPAYTIENRNELILIFNALVDEKKLLVFQKKNPKKQKAISIYLQELNARDEELKSAKRKIAAEKRSKYLKKEKEEKEQFEREYQESLAQVAEDVRKHNAFKEELENQKKEIKRQIVDLENELKKYSKKIGLDGLREEYKKLEERQNAPIETCCKHIKYTFYERYSDVYDEDIIDTLICLDCGFKFNDDSNIYQNLINKKYFKV
jgi:DNA repair exonuclease SbcCD ATPase subunit